MIVVGLNHVGLWTSILFASFGYDVIAYDPDEKRIQLLKRGLCYLKDPACLRYLQQYKEQIRFESSTDIFKEKSFAITITMNPNEEESRNAFYESIDEIGKRIQHRTNLLIRSTVLPGTNEKIFQYYKENTNYPVSVITYPCYSLPGYMEQEWKHPPYLSVGTRNEEDHLFMSLLLLPYIEKGMDIAYLSPETAELSLYARNAYLWTKQAFMNEWSMYCDAFHADIEELSYFLRPIEHDEYMPSHPQIHLFHSAMEKEFKIFMRKIEQENVPSTLFHATKNFHEEKLERMKKEIFSILKEEDHQVVAILGLSYNEKNHDVRDSIAFPLIQMLLEQHIKVRAYDRHASIDFKLAIGNRRGLRYGIDVKDTIKDADLIIILYDSKEWNALSLEMVQSLSKKNTKILNYAQHYPTWMK